MNSRLYSIPSNLISEYGTRDPLRIAERLNIHVRYISTKNQKGFCTNILNNYFLYINENLSPQMQRMTCAHELGHVLLHKDQLKRDKNGNFQKIVEMELFDITSQTEYEANLFAANLLIDDDRLSELLYEGQDIVTIARIMEVNVNLLAIKLAQMPEKDLSNRLPFTPNRHFMGRINDRADSL